MDNLKHMIMDITNNFDPSNIYTHIILIGVIFTLWILMSGGRPRYMCDDFMDYKGSDSKPSGFKGTNKPGGINKE